MRVFWVLPVGLGLALSACAPTTQCQADAQAELAFVDAEIGAARKEARQGFRAVMHHQGRPTEFYCQSDSSPLVECDLIGPAYAKSIVTSDYYEPEVRLAGLEDSRQRILRRMKECRIPG